MGKVVPSIYRTAAYFFGCKRRIQDSLAEFMPFHGHPTAPAFFAQKRRWGLSVDRISCPTRDCRGENRNKLSKIIEKSEENGCGSKKF
jgi:hypothetical protein